MEQTAICQVLERIEFALERVEAAARQTSDLRRRHERLRGTVEKSLAEIDGLIARQQP